MVSVLPSKIQITTVSGAAVEEERYNEGAELQLTCTVWGGNKNYHYFMLTLQRSLNTYTVSNDN